MLVTEVLLVLGCAGPRLLLANTYVARATFCQRILRCTQLLAAPGIINNACVCSRAGGSRRGGVSSRDLVQFEGVCRSSW